MDKLEALMIVVGLKCHGWLAVVQLWNGVKCLVGQTGIELKLSLTIGIEQSKSVADKIEKKKGENIWSFFHFLLSCLGDWVDRNAINLQKSELVP